MTSEETANFKKFNYNIKSYDFHTYFALNDKEETEFAINTFRASVVSEFAQEIEEKKIRYYKVWHERIGPHPDGFGMFEFDVRDSEAFLKLLNFYQLNHKELSVLIHPKTPISDLYDHTVPALWLGEKRKLNLKGLERI